MRCRCGVSASAPPAPYTYACTGAPVDPGCLVTRLKHMHTLTLVTHLNGFVTETQCDWLCKGAVNAHEVTFLCRKVYLDSERYLWTLNKYN